MGIEEPYSNRGDETPLRLDVLSTERDERKVTSGQKYNHYRTSLGKKKEDQERSHSRRRIDPQQIEEEGP